MSQVGGFFILGAILAAFANANAAELKEARVTQIVRDVKLLPNAAPARPAVVNDPVRDGTAVRTGVESRTELMFPDATLARLGANTIFSFTEGTRNLELTDGAMLLRVPKNAGGAKINTAAVTAAITGTTVMLEFHKNSYVKFIVLEGTGRIFLPNRVGESVLVHAGQMLITNPNAKNLSNPVDVDIRQLRKTSRLIKGFGKMGSENLIAQTEAGQDKERAEGELYETNLAIYGAGTSMILNDQVHIQETQIAAQQSPPPVVPPVVPSEFGPPETITSPNPYPLGANNELTTAGPPKVVAGATTNYGKVYRNTPLDGIRSLWFFRTTRAFDSASGFDTPDRSVFDLNNIAVFKFQNLQLVSNPTISVPNGITTLGLVGVDGISSALSGGALSFGGLNSVLLTTQKGSIILGGEISFQNIPNLFFYARGDNVALNLASPISGTSNLLLDSEGTVQVNGNITVDNFNAFSNSDFQQGSGIVTARDVTINSIGGNVAFDLSKFANLAGGGGTITLNANGSLTIIPNDSDPTTRNSITAHAGTIDFNSSSLFHFNFSNSDFVSLSAGAGGIQAPNVEFIGANLTLRSDGDINLFDTRLPSVKGQPIFSGLIDANGSIFANGDIQTAVLTAGGDISDGGLIFAREISAGGNISAPRIITAGGSINAGGNISTGSGPIELRSGSGAPSGNLTAGGDLFVGGGIFSSGAPTAITVGGNLSAPGLVAGTVSVGGEMKIANITGTSVSGVAANTITAGSILMINAPAFFPNYLISNDRNGVTPSDFTLTTSSLTSVGPRIPMINANGTKFSDPNSNPGSGGHITLNILGAGLTVGPQGDLSLITSNGGDFNFGGAYGGGNGGTINITAAGPITIDSPIEATSGRVLDGTRTAGNGGAIALNSLNDAVAINSRLQASSADPAITTARRRSANGGNITLKSGKPSGIAINISNTGEILSLLDATAPGPGGKVTILATGANSSVRVNGTLQADRGTIDIRHTGDAGQINLGGPGASDAADAHGDVIKVAALGNNGVLTIGNGMLSADTTLKLYSPGSNGTVNFIADVTLGGASTKIIAGNTVNIFNGVVVTVDGNHRASVFTNNANYSGFGGNGSRTGTFAGMGANNPLPLRQVPPLDAPGG
jgi:mannose-6-phosphate isomerase-like protein (cupin superfamily)